MSAFKYFTTTECPRSTHDNLQSDFRTCGNLLLVRAVSGMARGKVESQVFQVSAVHELPARPLIYAWYSLISSRFGILIAHACVALVWS